MYARETIKFKSNLRPANDALWFLLIWFNQNWTTVYMSQQEMKNCKDGRDKTQDNINQS